MTQSPANTAAVSGRCWSSCPAGYYHSGAVVSCSYLDAAADLIRSDGLDILIDLWGHTSGSRLTLFTHRPAPVQAGFVNFNQTTGLDCIDYVLHSDSMDAPSWPNPRVSPPGRN